MSAGLVLMYLLLGLVCTVVNELISRLACWRSKDLRNGIAGLLDDENAQAIGKDIRSHPLVRKVFSETRSERVSYLSSRAFATALLDTLAPGRPAAESAAMKHIGDCIDNLPSGRVRQTLQSLHKDANEDVDKLRARVASWYDDTMDRVGGIYKRRLQLVSLSVAAVLTVAFNADTAAVATRLWEDEVLRTQVTQMGTVAASEPTILNDARYEKATKQLEVFPIGWSNGPAGWFVKHVERDTAWDTILSWEALYRFVALLLGWTMTALAVSLGAPFWFEMLQKVNAIRATGKKPA